jgi:glycopeptide antibiotics resistance protein
MNRALLLLSKLLDRFSEILTLFVLAAIAVASLSPSGSAGDPGSADKSMHILAYAAATMPVAATPSKPILLLAFGIIAWSGAIELLQPLVGRGATVADLLANTVGVVLGLCLAYPLRWMLRRRGNNDKTS